MTNQEAFDIMVRHVIQQGRPAVNSEGLCRFRTDEGLKCAVGALIPEESYHEDIEGFDPHDFVSDGILDAKLDSCMLCSMQAAHDEAYRACRLDDDAESNADIPGTGNFLEDFLFNAKKVAHVYSLDATVCEVRV